MVVLTDELPIVRTACVVFDVIVAPHDVALIAAICTLAVTLAKPVIVVLPAARVVIPLRA
jgi:hypothetical protein